MTLQLFGITIHEADVAVTDLLLALLGAHFARNLWLRRHGSPLRAEGALINAGLAAAALAGAAFHAFFPAKTTTSAGFVAWIPVAIGIAVAAAAMLSTSLRLLGRALPASARRGVVAAYAVLFVLVVLVVNESYGSIVRMYGPALLLLIVTCTREWMRQRDRAWGVIVVGLLLSVVAALLQQAGVALHPRYADHNALYHLIQAAALTLIYRGMQRTAATSALGGAFSSGRG